MQHRYLPVTEEDRKEMLEAIGVSHVDDLFADIPEEVRFRGQLKVPQAMSEPELMRKLKQMAAQNLDFEQYACFLGAGIYDHYIPAVIPHLLSRSEFYTAYTPYQPEISQGELQAIFEFQSYICELTGMKVANASMYDGATALTEAGILAAAATNRRQLIVSRGVHPEAREILHTAAKGRGLEVIEAELVDGVTDRDKLASLVGKETAAVLIQSPNFFGVIEPLDVLGELAHEAGGLFIVSANPLSLGLLEAPGNLGADLVVGDVQPFGIPAAFGGPTCGYFAASEKWMRRMPGRIVGQTVDLDGRRGFVLTLQTREQHIRREKATSNICSNQALLALCASIYLSVMGRQGLKEVAEQNLQKAHYAAQSLAKVDGIELLFSAPFFNEFALRLPEGLDPAELNRKLMTEGIIGGYDLGRAYEEYKGCMLFAVTERRTKAEIDRLVTAVANACLENKQMSPRDGEVKER